MEHFFGALLWESKSTVYKSLAFGARFDIDSRLLLVEHDSKSVRGGALQSLLFWNMKRLEQAGG